MDVPSAMTPEQSSSSKRPRSPSGDVPLPASKVAKTHASHMQINYLARQHNENLPLVSVEDSLPSILRLIGEYDGVLHRHESIAGNLGACPLGPILLKRFERLFDGPPRILKSHGKDTAITWLDVVEFARNKPEQFNLEKMRNGVRVCQFYTKQSRVEISEEDYVLIASGMPQKLIPPQPIVEDEEKELGALEILEKNLSQVVQYADQVSARARQLNHKLKSRRTAILSRRENESDPKQSQARSLSSPLSPEETNGVSNKHEASLEASQSPPSGFMAVNMRQSAPAEAEPRSAGLPPDPLVTGSQSMFPGASTENVTIINGRSIKGASPTLRAELMKKFFSATDRETRGEDEGRRSSMGNMRSNPSPEASSKTKPRSGSTELVSLGFGKNSSTVAIPNTPASLLPHIKPSIAERDDGGPYKSEMVTRMESMHRGERVIPPCDRCRRLHMDCLKNLTACMGCTKKHAKCSWKDVRVEELQAGRVSPERNLPENGETETAPTVAGKAADKVSTPTTTNGNVTAKTEETPSGIASATLQVSAGDKAESSTARFDVRPMPVGQHFRDAAEGRGAHMSYSYSKVRDSIEQDENNEGDRLQALAAQVYRSASQSVRPQEG